MDLSLAFIFSQIPELKDKIHLYINNPHYIDDLRSIPWIFSKEKNTLFWFYEDLILSEDDETFYDAKESYSDLFDKTLKEFRFEQSDIVVLVDELDQNTILIPTVLSLSKELQIARIGYRGAYNGYRGPPFKIEEIK